MEQYYAAASKLAGGAVADAKVLPSLLGGCDPVKSGASVCAAAFIDGVGQRAYRRPLDAAEKDRLMGVFTATSAGADFKTGVTAVLRTMLQAPQFLYRVEMGTPVAGSPGIRKVDQYEMASRLSYLLWSSMPDAELFAAAKAGKLGTRDEVLAQARRMLADRRTRDVAAFFHRIQFKLVGMEALAKDATVFPAYKPGTGALLAQEAARFLDYVVWDGEGDLGAILTAPYTFMNADLAKFYGVTGPKTAAFEKVDVDGTQRAGLITQAGLMALLTPGSHTNPVRRGYYVRERLFCTPPPAPPASLMVKPPTVDKNASTRESFANHSQDPACSGCHVLLDPIGFALEKYDGAGLWRTTENGKTIDARGDLVGTDVAGAFDGPVELARKLAASGQVRECYVGQWFQFAQGRAGSPDDACTVANLAAAFGKPGAKIKDLLLGLTQTDAFLYRTGGQP
jgi:hypothetical protein